MATHSLAIAKASLAAGLMRPDPTSVIPHTEISQLHTLLENLLHRCSPGNIQLCKDWLLRNTLPSAARTTVFGKYLVTLSESLGNPEDKKISRSDNQTRHATRRKQLHVLYLLNDLLHHSKYHVESSSVHSTFTTNIQSHLIDLIGTTSAYDPRTFVNHHRKIQDLLDIWAEKCYFDPIYIQTLRGTVGKPLKDGPAGPRLDSGQLQSNLEEASGERKADAPFIMPSAHGDASMPYYDLPAGNMMPHIVPNSATPINPQSLRPLQFKGGPAEEILISAVKDFMREAGPRIKTGLDDETLPDTDELGNIVGRDVTTGELVDGEGYYGWSRAFCEKMKRRHNGTENAIARLGGDRSFDRSSSPRKRRRYSYSESSRDWDRGRSRARTASRSSSAGRRRGSRVGARRRSYSRSGSPSRAYHPPMPTENSPHARSESTSRSVSRSESYSPPPSLSKYQPNLPRSTLTSPPTIVQAQELSAGPPQFPQAFNQGLSLESNVFPVPPPPPPNYQGPWPPPPPPLPPAGHPSMSSARTSYSAFHPFAQPHLSGLNHSNQDSVPIKHGTWIQQSPDQSGHYPHPGSASISPAFSGHGQNNRSRPSRGSWS